MGIPTLEQVIRNHVHLPRTTNAGGWYQVLCKVCNDHGKKGKRAGFRFDGETVGYNCFNCNHSAVFDPSTNKTMPGKMVTVLEAFSIPKEEWQPIIFELMASTPARQHKTAPTIDHEPSVITLPIFFTPIDENGDDFDLYAIEYLRDERGIDWKEYPFYISRKDINPDSRKWYGRLIIPFYKDGKLVFYQGRDLTGKRQKKYLSAHETRDKILYGYESIYKDTDDPLYVVEGWFDAWHLDGVAVLSNRMTTHQIYWLNQSRRPKVVVPDKYGRGFVLAKQAIDLGWSISTPFLDWHGCKDPNDAIMKYGKAFTLKTLIQHTSKGDVAMQRLQFYKSSSE